MTSVSQEIAELLPFYVNGTLDADERAAVDAALKEDHDLALERRALDALRTEIKADDDGFSPGEFGLARLMRDIEAEPAIAAPSEAPAARGSVTMWRAAAIAAAVALVAVIAGPQLTDQGGAVYEQASGEDGGGDLILTFRPDATQAQISALLLDTGLVIVDGPSALGLYRVSATEGQSLTVLAEDLRARGDVIEGVDLVE